MSASIELPQDPSDSVAPTLLTKVELPADRVVVGALHLLQDGVEADVGLDPTRNREVLPDDRLHLGSVHTEGDSTTQTQTALTQEDSEIQEPSNDQPDALPALVMCVSRAYDTGWSESGRQSPL